MHIYFFVYILMTNIQHQQQHMDNLNIVEDTSFKRNKNLLPRYLWHHAYV